MEFNEHQPIYAQIANLVSDRILLQELKTEDKILSVRDLAAELRVNPNTVMRAYEYLQQQGIIYNKRGLGNYVAKDACSIIKNTRRESFFQNELPQFFNSIKMMGISFEDIEKKYRQYIDIEKK